MKNRYYMLAVLLIGIAVFFVAGCGEPSKDKYQKDFFAMDTYITCQVLGDDQAKAEAALARVDEAFLEIDRLTNRFNSNSEVAAVNKNAGIAPVKVGTDVFAMVETAIAWSDRTGGVFNILIGRVMDLWGFGTEHHAVPTDKVLAEALKKTDYHKVMLDKKNSTIFLPDKGMVIDLGGVAKGYATDKAVAALKEMGIKDALINAGGNVYAMGSKADEQPWRVGIQDPRDPKGIVKVLKVSDRAVISSGDYQRYFEVDGIRYHHILDPATGYPSRACAGTTVIMESATIADILSTVLFIQGPVKGIELAESLTEVDALMIVTAEGKTIGTSAMQDYIAEN